LLLFVRLLLLRFLLFIWGDRRSLVSESRCEVLTQALRGSAAFALRFLVFVGVTSHVAMVSPSGNPVAATLGDVPVMDR